ncbi:MAG TPA: ribosome-associated translation inhibitor RaiA [Proteobacteria bacterium]|nr:light-repressed protein A [bacterium BMS3Abin14]HDL54222.1 ribosome-associated translation inhibitor RaiA [Pseudomonadota bacterium]
MQIEVSFKRMEQSDALRSYVDEKLSKVLRPLMDPVSAQVVLHVEKYRHIAKVTVAANGIIIKGKEETNDMYSSIDLVLDKLDRQVKKYREKIQSRGDRDAVRVFKASHKIIHDAAEPEKAHEIIQQKEIILKPITVDEAVMQMELMNKSFLLFNNANSSELNVIYVRDDGHYGLIEPRMQD